MNQIRVGQINITTCRPRGSLIGFCSLIIDGVLAVHHIGIHTKLDGSLRLLYAEKLLPTGHRQPIVYPITRECGDYITQEVLKEYKRITERVRKIEDGVGSGQ